MKHLATYETGKGKTFDLTETLEKKVKKLKSQLKKATAEAAKQGEKAGAQKAYENLVINPAGPKDEKVILKHTQGTWTVKDCGNNPPEIWRKSDGKEQGDKIICTMHPNTPSQTNADAKLIAAAPFMLAMLQDAVDHKHVYDTNPALVEAFEKVIQMATGTTKNPAQQFVAKVNEEQPGTFDIDGGKDVTDYSNQSGGEVIVK